jgi:hypothetical protein
LVVQVRDARLQDAPATVVGEIRGKVESAQGALLATVEVAAESEVADLTVWAHVDADGDGGVSRGDFVTVQSYPLPAGPAPRMQVTVKRV